MSALGQKIKNYALDLGYARAGIAAIPDFAGYLEQIRLRGDVYRGLSMGKPGFAEQLDIRSRAPGAKAIVVLVWDYLQRGFPESLLGKIGRIYLGRCYNPPSHRINGARRELMKQFIARQGGQVFGDLFVPDRLAAAMAGVADFGRNNFAYAGKLGSFICITSLVVDLELECDAPTLSCKCPPDCRRCIEACPSRALYEPFRLNAGKCLAFNAFFTNAERGDGLSDDIPPEIRPHMGQQVHGCDLCQEACPRNQAALKAPKAPDPFLESLAAAFSLPALLHMREGFYDEHVEPVMYNYIKETRFFQRNAAVALGNTGDEAFVPDLEAELDHPAEVVRAHVAWALGRIGGQRALRDLEARLPLEPDAATAGEIRSAIAAIRCA